jgi:DNA mismatch repair protein MutH
MSDRIYHSKEELMNQAKLLLGKSFIELYDSEEIKKVLKNKKLTDKGNLGKLVEK